MIRSLQELQCSAVRSFKRRQRSDIYIPGLIRHYTMERSSGTTLYDETLTGNATINNMAVEAGVRGIALTGGSVASTTRNIDLGGDITFASFSAWVRRLNLATYSGVLFNADANRTVQIRTSSDGNDVSCYNGSWVDSNLVIADLLWHHIAGVLESANNIRLYVDGVKASGTLAINSGVVRYFGRPNTISGQEACCLDNIRLYTSILTELQVLDLYNEYR